MEGGIEAAYKRELEAHPDPEARLKEIRAWAEACVRRSARRKAFSRKKSWKLRMGQSLHSAMRRQGHRASGCGPEALAPSGDARYLSNMSRAKSVTAAPEIEALIALLAKVPLGALRRGGRRCSC